MLWKSKSRSNCGAHMLYPHVCWITDAILEIWRQQIRYKWQLLWKYVRKKTNAHLFFSLLRSMENLQDIYRRMKRLCGDVCVSLWHSTWVKQEVWKWGFRFWWSNPLRTSHCEYVWHLNWSGINNTRKPAGSNRWSGCKIGN